MSGHGEKFARKKELAIAALLSCTTIAEAAKQAQVSEATLWRWLKVPEFAEHYARAKSEVLQGTINRLRQGGRDSADSLCNMATNPAAPATAQVSAARAVIEFLLQAHQIEVFESRLDAIERAGFNQKTRVDEWS